MNRDGYKTLLVVMYSIGIFNGLLLIGGATARSIYLLFLWMFVNLTAFILCAASSFYVYKAIYGKITLGIISVAIWAKFLAYGAIFKDEYEEELNGSNTVQLQASAPEVMPYPTLSCPILTPAGVPPPNADTQFGAPRLPITSRNQTELVQPSAPEGIPYPLTQTGAPPYPLTQSGTPSYPQTQVQTSATGELPYPPDPDLPTYAQTQFGAPSLPSLQQDTSRNQSTSTLNSYT